jgi:hypothetical protein
MARKLATYAPSDTTPGRSNPAVPMVEASPTAMMLMRIRSCRLGAANPTSYMTTVKPATTLLLRFLTLTLLLVFTPTPKAVPKAHKACQRDDWHPARMSTAYYTLHQFTCISYIQYIQWRADLRVYRARKIRLKHGQPLLL